MDRFFSFLQVNALAVLCFIVAGGFWKSYFQEPHRHLERADLVETTGTMEALSGLVSLPSGSAAGSWLLLSGEPKRSFSLPSTIPYRAGNDGVSKGAEVTVAYSPEEDPATKDAEAFSFRFKGKDYLDPDAMVASHNRRVADKRNTAITTTLAGFAALGLVWVLRKKVFPRLLGRK